MCSTKKITFFKFLRRLKNHSNMPCGTPGHRITIPEAPYPRLRHFRENLKFVENRYFGGSQKKSLRHCGFLSRDRIEATNAFLDRSWHTLVGKIAPVSNEFTDSEISSFLWPIFQLLSLAKLSQISQCSGITLRAVRLYESYAYSYPGRMHPCGAWAPGRAR